MAGRRHTLAGDPVRLIHAPIRTNPTTPSLRQIL